MLARRLPVRAYVHGNPRRKIRGLRSTLATWAAELRKRWGTKRGQIWEMGAHRLMCSDNANGKDVAALMAGETARLCATDPPYLVSYDAKKHP